MKEEKEQTVIEKTLLYLENYREMERYINEAVSETSQVPDIGKYNISAEKAFLQSVRECRAETVILFEHLKKALASLKEDAEAAGELYYDEYYYPDDKFAERMSVVVWFILSLGCAILWVGIPLLICGLIVYTELEEHCPELMGDMTDRNTEEFDKEENK